MNDKYNNKATKAADANTDDGWPWPLLLLVALKELHLTEEQFWNMTPIKYAALVEALGELNSTGNEESSNSSRKPQPKMTTIDKIPGW